MRHYWLFLRATAAFGIVGIFLCGCETMLTPFVGQSAEAKARATPPAPPPGPPPSTAFVNDSTLSPGFAGQTILPPTLPTAPDTDAIDDLPAAARPHRVIAAIPLSSDGGALAALSAAANREQGGSDAHFVLLVLSPPAADAATLDRNTTAARLAANMAVKVMGDGGIGPDRIEVSMATSPAGGAGELRLYRR